MKFRDFRLFLIAVLACQHVAGAGVLFVDNRSGSDAADGRFPRSMSPQSGPVRTIRRVLELAQHGETIELTKNAQPYYEALPLTGVRHSGSAENPFIIRGNGAILSGLRALPPAGWEPVGQDTRLWQLSFTRKGYYVLLREGVLVPEFLPQSSADGIDSLPAGRWMSRRGGFYYRSDSAEPPAKQTFAHAGAETGISLYRTSHVWIQNLTVQHFRIDGFHAHDLCDGILLENLELRQNGRAGLAVTGTSQVDVSGSRITENGRYSAFSISPARLYINDSELDVEPVVRKSQDLD
ncbi:MAG TPA: right-handed parallel beta-helix repeat-containing protein [Planctomycetaceae bacterium]|nr:right-handed parallel beta-helix repeat-containing protein [Planctomycetaceae bacterium]